MHCYWNVFRIKLWYVKQFQPNANSHNTRKCEIYAIRSTWLISQAETNSWWVLKKGKTKSDRINAETRSLWRHRVMLRLEWKLVWKEQSDNKHERVESGKSVRRFNIRIELMLRLWIKHLMFISKTCKTDGFLAEWEKEAWWTDENRNRCICQNPYNHRPHVSCLPSKKITYKTKINIKPYSQGRFYKNFE